MIIAIPVDDKSLNSNVCISFGRTPYFAIYNQDTKQCEYLDNSAIASIGGAGIKASQSLVDSGVNILLTPRCGENAVSVLDSAGIAIYKTMSGTAQNNIDAYLSGNLSILSEVHAGFHGHGG